MAQSYHVTSRFSANPKKPSSLCSGLGMQGTAVSLSQATMSEKLAVEAGDPGPELKQKVVAVIGAGISGLRAAMTLQRHGVSVVVLEARDRIGGRIHTIRTSCGIRDIGAAWMHETSQNKLIRLIPKLGIEYYYDDGQPLYVTEFGKTGAQFKVKKLVEEYADHIEYEYSTNPSLPDRSVSDSIAEFVEKHELITADERAWAPQAVKEVELWIGTSCEQASSKHLSYFITERNLYMKGGYDSIVNWTAESLKSNPDTIRLNHTVEKIKWSEGGAQIAFRNENGPATLEADAVVVTVPLGCLHHDLISFEPQLPGDLRNGLAKFSYGALGKVFFQFADVFWSKENDQFVFYPSPEEDEDEAYGSSAKSNSSTLSVLADDNILNYATVTINLWIMTGSKQLCVQIAEPLTQRIEAMTDKKELYKFFEPLFKVLRTEPYKALPRLVDVESTHWTQDPLAGYGSYSADKVGDEPQLWLNALENHKDSRVQFAGEHCTRVANGCVHGAFATGETAAKNLLRVFDIAYDGGDCVSIA